MLQRLNSPTNRCWHLRGWSQNSCIQASWKGLEGPYVSYKWDELPHSVSLVCSRPLQCLCTNNKSFQKFFFRWRNCRSSLFLRVLYLVLQDSLVWFQISTGFFKFLPWPVKNEHALLLGTYFTRLVGSTPGNNLQEKLDKQRNIVMLR